MSTKDIESKLNDHPILLIIPSYSSPHILNFSEYPGFGTSVRVWKTSWNLLDESSTLTYKY